MQGTGYFTVPALRAYFQSQTSAGIKAYQIVLEDETTSIPSVVGSLDVATGVLYNLAGQRVDAPVGKGVYLQQGKKFFYRK